jgi:hypothetical protein
VLLSEQLEVTLDRLKQQHIPRHGNSLAWRARHLSGAANAYGGNEDGDLIWNALWGTNREQNWLMLTSSAPPETLQAIVTPRAFSSWPGLLSARTKPV